MSSVFSWPFLLENKLFLIFYLFIYNPLFQYPSERKQFKLQGQCCCCLPIWPFSFSFFQTMANTTRLATIYFLLTLAAASSAIKCWKCGQYSDGVGSITPCSNKTAVRLEECPSNAKYCIVSILILILICSMTKELNQASITRSSKGSDPTNNAWRNWWTEYTTLSIWNCISYYVIR